MKKLAPITLICSIAGLVHADFVPIPITTDSYNQDMVVEKSVTAVVPTVTTATMDAGTNNNNATWYEIGYNLAAPDTGIPHAGQTFVNQSYSDHSYKMAPDYTQPDAILLDAQNTNATFTFTTPGKYAAFSLLTSGGNGGCVFNYTINFSDGTSETGQTNSPDWYNGQNPAWISHGRVQIPGFGFDTVNDPANVNPRLMSRDFNVTATGKTVTSVSLTFVSASGGAHTCFMAISGATTAGGAFNPIDVTGYTQDVIVEQQAPKPTMITAYSTANLDNGVTTNGNTIYEMGFDTVAPTTGLPAAGTMLTNASASDHRYLLPPDYTTNDAVLVDYFTTASINLATPAAYSGLSFLATAGNGPITVGYTINFIDGTSETGQFVVPNWYDNNTPTAFVLNGRVDVGNSVPNAVSSGNPKLFGLDITLVNSKTSITNIGLNWVGTSDKAHAAILAVSGTTGALKPILDYTQPTNTAAWADPGSYASFTIASTYSGTGPFTFQWLKGTNGVYVNVTNGGEITGATTDTLTFNGVSMKDMADYVAVVSNAGGSTTSHVGTLTVLSTLPSICASGAAVVGYKGTWPSGENPANMVDGTVNKYLNFGLSGGQPFQGPVGAIVTPTEGRSILGAIRVYTANDTSDRDPMDITVEGSNDGGNSYSLICSNALNLSLTRNSQAAGTPVDPLSMAMQQIMVNNTKAYATYRITFTNVRNAANVNSMQVGEVELLGNQDTSGFPYFTSEPRPVTVYFGDSATFSADPTGNPAPALQWEKIVGNTTNLLSDNANISGSTTAALTIKSAAFSDAGTYVLVVTNRIGASMTVPVNLTVLTKMTNILVPGDPVVNIGGTNAQVAITTNASSFGSNLVDNTTTKWVNGGEGFNTGAGFGPFEGPVGFTVTPSVGTTVISGIRIFTSDSSSDSDPADFKLEGSNNGGTTYTTIASGPLNLPAGRNSTGGVTIDPLLCPLQEVLFSGNNGVYSSYRVTFSTVVNTNAATLQVAEVQLLGVPAQLQIGSTLGVSTANGKLSITSSRAGELWSTTELKGAATVWKDEGAISGSVTITPEPGTPAKFYRVVTQ